MKTIVCLSSQGWNSDLWTNKQHIMSRFAKKGYRILYVNKEIRSFFECCYYSMFKKSKEFPYFGVYDLTEGVSFANSYPLLFQNNSHNSFIIPIFFHTYTLTLLCEILLR